MNSDIKMKDEEIMKTGTTTVGIVCKNGVVLAADKRATAGYLVAAKKVKKIVKITDDIAVTMAGTVSDVQLLTKLIRAELKLNNIRTKRINTVSEAANLLASIVYNNIRKFSVIPGISHFVMGGKDSEGFYIFDIGADGSITDVDDFVSSGSGSVMAYGVLETLYKPDLTVEEGVDLGVKSVNAAMQRDVASGNGINVVTITSEGVQEVIEKELNTKIEQ
ncbi:proteasome subunit beta [Candidatus Woesearchaeota archaeon]|nr:proteasome subunit beta [Candidatus Woesearchaeota archaeon]